MGEKNGRAPLRPAGRRFGRPLFLPDLIADDHAAALLKKIRPFEQILWDVLKKEKGVPSAIRPKANEILVHGHCHQ
jgi:hypothetical protein